MARKAVQSPKAVKLNLTLHGLEPEDENPTLAVHAIAGGKVIDTIKVQDGGTLGISARTMEAATGFAVTSADREPDDETLKSAYRLRPAQLQRLAAKGGQLALSPARWRPLLPFFRCVDGKVRKCWWWPHFVRATSIAQQAVSPRLGTEPLSRIGRSAASVINDFTLVPFRPCKPVCEGVVEVYERICCCNPVFIEPLIPDLIDKLKDKLHPIPKPKFPPVPDPRPGPDPVPFREAGIFVGGTLDPVAENAASDIAFLQDAQPAEAREYVLARPYLIRQICSCGTATYRGSDLIGPGGEFSLCFPSFPFLRVNCHREYAFRVRQVINGTDTVIYDGLASNSWFDEGDDITLTTYLPWAVDCEDDPGPFGDGSYTMLERIGSTPAWRLKTPTPTGWDRATVTANNDGLGFPAASLAAARGTYDNRNWGGTLPLYYTFPESLKATGAVWYRVRVTQSDAFGNPVGTPTYLDDPVTWKYVKNQGGFPPVLDILQETLNDPGAPSFHKIPYARPSGETWMSGFFHAHVDTTDFANGRHFVTLELYDAAKNRMVPNNAGDAAPGDVAAAFAYEWWHDASTTGEPTSTTNVPWAGLTHMFWWDNRSCVADIQKLVKDGVANAAECQFMSGTDASQFSVEFAANHPHPWFMHSYRLWWKRGLNGPSKTLVSGDTNVPPLPVFSESFGTMLNYHPGYPGNTLPAGMQNQKCTFSLLLDVDTKTFNGSSILNFLDDHDVASFALDVTPAP